MTSSLPPASERLGFDMKIASSLIACAAFILAGALYEALGPGGALLGLALWPVRDGVILVNLRAHWSGVDDEPD